MTQSGKYCSRCDAQTLHSHSCFGFGWGCLLTVITGGLFIPFWIIIKVIEALTPWRCQVCGTARII